MIYIGNIEILTAKSAIYLGNVGIDIVPFDTCGAQGVVLQVERLRAIGFGDAGISDQHVSQTFV